MHASKSHCKEKNHENLCRERSHFMACPNCGEEISEEDSVCPHCGALIEEPCHDIMSDLADACMGFFKPQKLPVSSEGCEHLRTTQFYDIAREKVFVRCSDCGAILGIGIDPEENERRMAKDPRNLRIYEALRRRRS